MLRDLLAGGLPIKVSVASFGAGVGTVEVSNGGTTYRFTPAGNAPKPLLWSANGGLPAASLVLYGTAPAKPVAASATEVAPGLEVARVDAEGPWALFRLMDKARMHNAGPQAIKASFGTGNASTTLLIALPGETNPFTNIGPWSFRCPARL